MRLATAFGFTKTSKPFTETRCKHDHQSLGDARACADARYAEAVAENGGKKNGSSHVLPCIIEVVGN
jgi:hypothetical protein